MQIILFAFCYIRRKNVKYLLNLNTDYPRLTLKEVWNKAEKQELPDWWNPCKRWKNDGLIAIAYGAAIIVPPVVVLGFIWKWYS
ncbi:MAG TPA: hypothetical protein ENI79_05405 [Rhodospirillales bacterium]|nr:hypothetical protein [Rhodospirillales bacterium]